MANSIKNKSGYVLFLALFLAVLISLYLFMLINMQYRAAFPSIKKMNALKAELMAMSGLAAVQAYTAENSGKSINQEDSQYVQKIDSAGSFILSVHRAGGWLQVKSSGIWLKDTVTFYATLGCRPPEFTENAVTLSSCNSTVVIADRTSIKGNISTRGNRKPVIKGSGYFQGRTIPFHVIKYDMSSFENQMDSALNRFTGFRAGNGERDAITVLKPELLSGRDMQNTGLVCIFGNVTISDTQNFYGAEVWIDGNAVFTGSSYTSNLKAVIKGNVCITGKAAVENSLLFCYGNFTAQGQSRIRADICCAETLNITENSKVLYPSVLYLSDRGGIKRSSGNRILLIQGNASVCGTVLTGQIPQNSASPAISIIGRANVQGVVFTPGLITLYGNVEGSIYAGNIVYRRSRSVYEGWLMEASVNHIDLSGMVLPLVFSNPVPEYIWMEKETRLSDYAMHKQDSK